MLWSLSFIFPAGTRIKKYIDAKQHLSVMLYRVLFCMIFQYWLCPKGLCNCLPQSDTEFWDKMQAEWEELARRNWLEDADSEGPIPPNFSSTEKVFSANQNALHQLFSTTGPGPLYLFSTNIVCVLEPEPILGRAVVHFFAVHGTGSDSSLYWQLA